MKDIQFHPVNDSILHADFLEINDTKPIEIAVPVRLTGNSVGVRAGGKLVQKAKKIRIKALAANLPDAIEVDIETLEIGKSVKVGDLSMENVTFLDSPNNQVVSVNTTRQVAAEAADAKKEEKKK